MLFLLHACRTGRDTIREVCGRLNAEFPAFMAHAVVVAVPVPGTLKRLDGRLGGYAMCLNHWLRFLPVPVILISAEWLRDDRKLQQRYRHDAATGYHPDCGGPIRYLMAHELAHFIYGRLGREKREAWKSSFEPGKPSGYSTTPEEGFCEAFAGHVAGLEGGYHERAGKLAHAGAINGRQSAPRPARQ